MESLPPELRRVEIATATRQQTGRAHTAAILEHRAAIRAALTHGHTTTEVGRIAHLSRQRVNLCRNGHGTT